MVNPNVSFYCFRRPLFPIRQNWKVPPSADMAIPSWHNSKIWIRATHSSQCGLPCSMFLSQTVSRCRICLLCLPFNILQIYTNLLYLSHSICQYNGKKEEVKIKLTRIFIQEWLTIFLIFGCRLLSGATLGATFTLLVVVLPSFTQNLPLFGPRPF